jgi:hypothetical protein
MTIKYRPSSFFKTAGKHLVSEEPETAKKSKVGFVKEEEALLNIVDGVIVID